MSIIFYIPLGQLHICTNFLLSILHAIVVPICTSMALTKVVNNHNTISLVHKEGKHLLVPKQSLQIIIGKRSITSTFDHSCT